MTEGNSEGLVQVFTGNGKGKTTAALGAVLRALGHGFKVCIVFFMKGDYPYGEFSTLAKLSNVDIASFGFRQLTDPAKIKPEEIEQARLALSAAREAVLSGNYRLVVMDEVNVALAMKMIELDDVINALKNNETEIVLDAETIERARKPILRMIEQNLNI